MLYLYKSTIRPGMEYCCHIWAGAPARHLSLLDSLQRHIVNLVGHDLSSSLEPLSLRRSVASLSLFYRYYNGRCSKGLSLVVPPNLFFCPFLYSDIPTSHNSSIFLLTQAMGFDTIIIYTRTVGLCD